MIAIVPDVNRNVIVTRQEGIEIMLDTWKCRRAGEGRRKDRMKDVDGN